MTFRHLVVTTAAAMLLVVASGCSEPPPGDAPAEGTGDETPAPEDEPDDGSRDQLDEVLTQLRDTLAAAQDHLSDAQAADTTSAAGADAGRALQLLLDEAEATTDAAGTEAPAVLPSRSPERGSIGERDDLLSTTLALARDVGGSTGTVVTAMLRDEVAGDLGAWERDAEGVVASAERAGTAAGDLDAVTAAILELPGETTRALAWAFRAADAGDLETMSTAAERGAAHLELATVAVDALLDSPASGNEPGGAP